MTRILSLVLAAALAISVAVPVLAADPATGSTDETLNIGSTIAMTVPADFTYDSRTGDIYTETIAVTGLATNAVNGMTVTMTVNAAGTDLIAPANRSFGAVTQGGGFSGSAGAGAARGTVTNTVPYTLGTTGQQPTAATLTFDTSVHVETMTPGLYTGSLNFTATAID